MLTSLRPVNSIKLFKVLYEFFPVFSSSLLVKGVTHGPETLVSLVKSELVKHGNSGPTPGILNQNAFFDLQFNVVHIKIWELLYNSHSSWLFLLRNRQFILCDINTALKIGNAYVDVFIFKMYLPEKWSL